MKIRGKLPTLPPAPPKPPTILSLLRQILIKILANLSGRARAEGRWKEKCQKRHEKHKKKYAIFKFNGGYVGAVHDTILGWQGLGEDLYRWSRNSSDEYWKNWCTVKTRYKALRRIARHHTPLRRV